MTHSQQFFHNLTMLRPQSMPSRLQKIYTLLTYEASPVLRSIKPAVLVNIRPERDSCTKCTLWSRCLSYIERAMGLSALELAASETRMSILLYDEELLKETLRDASANALLLRHGYPVFEGDLTGHLEHLHRRCRNDRFPHEIGVFLGYPPADVEAFIQHRGQRCKLCGYWKVYHDIDTAVKTFRSYDEAREHMAALLNEGIPCHEAVKAILAS